MSDPRSLDLHDPRCADFSKADVRAFLGNEYVSAMFVFLKSSLLYEANNPALVDACERIAEVVNAIWNRSPGAAEMRFRYDGIYVNQNFLLLHPDKLGHADYVQSVWRALEVAAIAPTRPTDRREWLELAGTLCKVLRAETDEMLADVAPPQLGLLQPRVEDPRNAEHDARFGLSKSYYTAVVATREFMAGHEEPRPLVEIKRPLTELLSHPRSQRAELLRLVFDRTEDGGLAQHLVNTGLLAGMMAEELGLERPHRIELAIAGLLHGCDPDPAVTIRRQVHLRQGHQRNLRRMTVANEYRVPVGGGGDYKYETGVTSRIVAVAHAFEQMISPPGARRVEQAVAALTLESGRLYDGGAVQLLDRSLR